jgi:hypothetical protein
MNYYPEFAGLLNHYLQRADQRSAAWLARKLQLHPSTVAKWLNGDSRPRRPEVVIQLADILQVYDAEERQKLLQAAGYGYVAPTEAPAATTAPVDQRAPLGEQPTKSTSPPSTAFPVARWSQHLSLLVSLLGGLSLLYTLLVHRRRTVQ